MCLCACPSADCVRELGLFVEPELVHIDADHLRLNYLDLCEEDEVQFACEF